MKSVTVHLKKLELFLDKFPWLLPAISFAAGWGSFVLVHRGNELAKITALIVLAGWVWILFKPLFVKHVRVRTGRRFSYSLSCFVSQTLQQEILFFSLPFLLLSTSIHDPGQILFTGLVVIAAIVSTIDPVYEKYIDTDHVFSIAFHSLSSFVAALVVLPIAVNIPLEQSFMVALGFVVLGLVLSAPRVISFSLSPRMIFVRVLAMLCIPAALIAGQSRVPPAGLVASNSRITDVVTNHQPGLELNRVSVDELQKGLYAYSAISAPQGLTQEIVFHWKHADYSEKIVSEITGGREQGFRTYSHKKNFIENPEGEWVIEITTAQGQLLEKLEFEVGA